MILIEDNTNLILSNNHRVASIIDDTLPKLNDTIDEIFNNVRDDYRITCMLFSSDAVEFSTLFTRKDQTCNYSVYI